MNDASGSPVANCSVFLNSTSKGTTTSNSGEFELSNIGGGKYELIVSSIGYETYSYSFSASQLPLELNIRIKQKATDLSAVTVEPFVKDGWETWGQTFIDNLIGTTDNAGKCAIKNKEVVRFRFSRKYNQLTAIADEPVIIENKALGYIIKFQLEEFSVNFDSHKSIYSGYPLFNEIPAKSKELQDQRNNIREKTYLGSLMHFMRCLYFNQLHDPGPYKGEGFEISREIKLANAEKLRIEEMYKRYELENKALPADSLKYYKKVMRQPDSIHHTQLLNSNHLVTSGPDHIKTLFFTDKISISFGTKRHTDTEFLKSVIYLITPAPVQIQENGHYDPALEIYTLGHWALSEKLANMLPLDYWPEE